MGSAESKPHERQKTDQPFPNQLVRDFVAGQRQAKEGELTRNESSRIINTKASSLLDIKKLTVKTEDVEKGEKDLAELRSDYSGSFYSNFTAQHYAQPPCIGHSAYAAAYWTYLTFMASAMGHLLFNVATLSLGLSGLVSTLACSERMLDFRAPYQTSVLFLGLVFPMVFLIGATFARREKAVERLAVIKANAIQLVLKLMSKDASIESPKHSEHMAGAVKVVQITHDIIEEIGKYLPQDCRNSGVRLASIYKKFVELQDEPECAMLTRFMLCEFEKLRVLRDYRTPWKLNYFCFFFGSTAPVFCGPLFASMGCKDRYPSRTAGPGYACGSGYGTPGAYLSALFFAIVISALLAIIKALEDPFSLDGPDDVISSFSVEANAILQMIEDRGPGTLMAISWSGAAMSPETRPSGREPLLGQRGHT